MSISLNYIHGNSIDVFADTLERVDISRQREIITYRSKTTKRTKKFPRYMRLPNVSMSGKFVSGFMNFPIGFPSSTAADLLERIQKIEYLQTLDDDVLLCLGSEARAMYGNISGFENGHGSQSPVSNRFFLQFVPTFPIAQGEVYEAENVNHDGTETSDSDSSGDKCVQIDTQYDQVLITLTQSAYRLPEGNYKVFVRAKDSNQIVDDLGLEIYNNTDSTSVGSSTATLTESYGLYESDTFTVASDDSDDSLQIYAYKATSDANIISIDFIGFVRV